MESNLYKFEGREGYQTSTHGTYKSLEQKIKYSVLIFEISGEVWQGGL